MPLASRRSAAAALALVSLLLLPALPGLAVEPSSASADAPVIFGGRAWDSWAQVGTSGLFEEEGRRCGTVERWLRPGTEPRPWELPAGPSGLPTPADCSASATNPSTDYAGPIVYRIPVVVHVIEASDGEGGISDLQVQSQIEILNEDFRALLGTNGADGTDVAVEFFLATEDPTGNPTTGIRRASNDTWFADGGTYYETLAWDPSRYMNVYTNEASGALGYVPFLPADFGGAFVGTNQDRVVVLWSAFGRNAPLSPYNQGRTLTHEVGHYLGLEHTFNPSNVCPTASAPGCYADGDLICDTETERSPRFGCPTNPTSCSTPDPYTNYMDYTDDLCMERFSVEQARRMRCTLEHWRPDLAEVVDGSIFTDGFESGDTTAWSATVPSVP